MIPWSVVAQAVVIIAAGIYIYWPTLHGAWIWDDFFYLPNHPLVNDPDRLWKTWFAPGSFLEYYPLEETVQWAQWQLWHNDTLGYHVTNIVLHLVSAFLVWRLLAKLQLRWAWLGGLLFAIHPAQVESVAYIAELKNTLSLPPFLLAMCAWIDYDTKHKPRDYWLALGYFLIAMLCKITMAPFPVLLLLYAWWKRDRIDWRDLKAAAPFFVISLALGVSALTIGAHYTKANHAVGDVIPLGGILSRIESAGLTSSFYLFHAILPVGLSPIYPLWTVDPPTPLRFLPWLLFGALMFYLWKKRQGWGRHVLFALGFIFLFLAPFMGFISVSYMTFTWVMDHFLYIPVIGWIGLVVATWERVANSLSKNNRAILYTITALVFAIMAWASHDYAAIFHDEDTLWRYTLAQDPGAWPAANNLGIALQNEGRIPEAIACYEKALAADPRHAQLQNSLGNAWLTENQLPEAIVHYQQAVQIDPDYPEAHNNLAVAYLRQGKMDEAIEHYETALRIDPNFAEAHNGLGSAYYNKGRTTEAIAQYQQALALNPAYVNAHDNLGNVLQAAGHYPEALEQYQQALQLNPDDKAAQTNLARTEALQNVQPAKK